MHTSNSNKSRIIIRVIVLKYFSYIFNQVVICRNRGLEESQHLWQARVRGESTFVALTVERVKDCIVWYRRPSSIL